MNIKALLNVQNFKTKSPFDKWSILYDRGLQNTAFCRKNNEISAVCQSFSEVLTETKSKQKEVQRFMNCKNHRQRGSFK